MKQPGPIAPKLVHFTRSKKKLYYKNIQSGSVQKTKTNRYIEFFFAQPFVAKPIIPPGLETLQDMLDLRKSDMLDLRKSDMLDLRKSS